MEQKMCTNPICAEINPQDVANFWKNSSSKDGFATRCKTCQTPKIKAYYAKNKKQIQEKKRNYYTTEKGKQSIKNRNKSKAYQKYQKQYRESGNTKKCQQRYNQKPKGRATMLWHCMNQRCQKHKNYKSVEVRMSKNEWLEFAIPAIIEFLKNNPSGKPSVHRFNDLGHYEIGNIQIIDKKENMMRSSFLVKAFGLSRDDSLDKRLKDAVNVVIWSLCDSLDIPLDLLMEKCNEHKP